MAQEKARRQARKMRSGGYVEAPPAEPEPGSLQTSEPQERMEKHGDFAERAAEAAFAARVARVAREHPGAVGQRQSHQPASPPENILVQLDIANRTNLLVLPVNALVAMTISVDSGPTTQGMITN